MLALIPDPPNRVNPFFSPSTVAATAGALPPHPTTPLASMSVSFAVHGIALVVVYALYGLLQEKVIKTLYGE